MKLRPDYDKTCNRNDAILHLVIHSVLISVSAFSSCVIPVIRLLIRSSQAFSYRIQGPACCSVFI